MELQQYPKLKPVPGLMLEAYFSRSDIGSGRRVFVVYKVGPKFISLFYAPQLKVLRLRRGEFAQAFIAPLFSFSPAAYKDRLRKKAETYARLGMQHPAKVVGEVLELPLTCGHDRFTIAKAEEKKP